MKKRCSSRTDVVIYVAQSAESSLKKIDADWDPDINPRVEGRRRYL